jgi:hypothetical protein
MRSGLKESCRRSSSRLQRVRRVAGAYLLVQVVVRAEPLKGERFGIKGGSACATATCSCFRCRDKVSIQ